MNERYYEKQSEQYQYLFYGLMDEVAQLRNRCHWSNTIGRPLPCSVAELLDKLWTKYDEKAAQSFDELED